MYFELNRQAAKSAKNGREAMMRLLLAYVIGLSLVFILTVCAVFAWDSSHRALRLPTRPGSETMGHAATLIFIVAFVGAVALPLAYVSTVGQRKPWPMKSFILGVATGLCLGIAVDMLCVYAVHHGWK